MQRFPKLQLWLNAADDAFSTCNGGIFPAINRLLHGHMDLL